MSYERFVEFMKLNDQLDDYDREGAHELYKQYLQEMTPSQLTKYLKRYAESNKPKAIRWQMFTFTTRPDKRLPADQIAQVAYINSILKRKDNLQLNDLSYCIEHEDSNLHYHIALSSFRSIPPDAFKQFAKNFGFVKKSSKMSRNADGIADYITKESSRIDLMINGEVVNA